MKIKDDGIGADLTFDELKEDMNESESESEFFFSFLLKNKMVSCFIESIITNF